MQTGPEAMPVFDDTTITPSEKRDIIAYVTETRTQPNPGGFSLGRVGPVTEGLVAFLGLLLFMVLMAMWITGKRREGNHEGRVMTDSNVHGQSATLTKPLGRRAERPGRAAPGDRHPAPGRGPDHARARRPERGAPAGPRAAARAGRPARQAKRGRAVVAACFILAMLAGLGFIACLLSVFERALGQRGVHSNLALGTAMAVAFLPLGVGAVIWVRRLMPKVEIAEDRQAAASSPEAREEFAKTFMEGAEASGFVKRPLIRALPDRRHRAGRRWRRSCCCATWARCPTTAWTTRCGARACG